MRGSRPGAALGLEIRWKRGRQGAPLDPVQRLIEHIWRTPKAKGFAGGAVGSKRSFEDNLRACESLFKENQPSARDSADQNLVGSRFVNGFLCAILPATCCQLRKVRFWFGAVLEAWSPYVMLMLRLQNLPSPACCCLFLARGALWIVIWRYRK